MTKITGVLLAIFLMGSAQAAEHFLDAAEIARLTPIPKVDGISMHIYEGVDTSDYDRRIVGGVTFYFAEKSKAKGIDADEMKLISDSIKAALFTAASERGEVSLTPGEGAIMINVAITEINMQNKKRGLLGYTPIGLAASTVGNLAGLRIQLRDAKIEGEAVDSVTGSVLAVFRIDQIGNFDGKKAMSWEDLGGTLHDTLVQVIGVRGW